MAVGLSSLRRSALCAFGSALLFLAACKGGSGASGGDKLVVDPGGDITIKLGSAFLGLSGTFSEAKILRSTGQEVVGRLTISGDSLHFQYARGVAHETFDSVRATVAVPQLGDLALRAYLSNTPPVVDFATTKTFDFFDRVLLRAPTDAQEVDKVMKSFSAAMQKSCAVGRPVPDALLANQFVNNAIYDSQEWADLRSEYELPYEKWSDLIEVNTPPNVISGYPYPIKGSLTHYNIPEGLVRAISVRIMDGERNLFLSKWTVDDKVVSDFSYIQQERDSGTEAYPEEYSPLTLLSFTTDYEMSTYEHNAKHQVSLFLCDGGATSQYDYEVEVNDTNRMPVFAQVPSDSVPLNPGEVAVVELESEDPDGNSMSFNVAGSPENVLSLPPNADVTDLQAAFMSAKKLAGLFILRENVRDSSAIDFAPRLYDPWLETLRTGNAAQETLWGMKSKIQLPERIEFLPPTSGTSSYKALVTGLGKTTPQLVDVSFELLSASNASSLKETLGIKFSNIDLETPVLKPKGSMYCISTEKGFGITYKLTMACHSERYPINFSTDGEWNMIEGCPDPGKYPTEVPSALGLAVVNNRCQDALPVYSVSPGPGRTSKAKFSLIVRPERYQGPAFDSNQKSKQMYSYFSVADDFMGVVGASVSFDVGMADRESLPVIQKLTLFDQYHPNGLVDPKTNFDRTSGVNSVLFDYANPNMVSPDFSEIGILGRGAHIARGQRSPMAMNKSYWWQEIRWELVEEPAGVYADANLASFVSRPFLTFLTPHPNAPDAKILVSAPFDKFTGADKAGTLGRAAYPVLNPDTRQIADVKGSTIRSYQIVSADPDGNFVFKVVAGKIKAGVAVDVYCQADVHYARNSSIYPAVGAGGYALDSDFRLKCAESVADLQSTSTYLRFVPGLSGIFTGNSAYAWADVQTQLSGFYWNRWQCQYYDVGTFTFKPCYKHPQVKSDSLLSGTGTQKFALEDKKLLTTTTGECLWSDMLSVPGEDKGCAVSTVDFLNLGGGRPAKLFAHSQRLILLANLAAAADPQSISTKYRWCRYALRNRMLTLALTCTDVPPANPDLDVGYPALYSKVGPHEITLEFNLAPTVNFDFHPDGWGMISNTDTIDNPGLVKQIDAPTEVGGNQELPSNTLVLPTTFDKFLYYKVSYDASELDAPRAENVDVAGGEPLWNMKIYRLENGEELFTAAVPHVFHLNEEGNIVRIDMGMPPTPEEYTVEELGIHGLKKNEILVAWASPAVQGLFRLDLELSRRRTDQTRTFSVYSYVHPRPLFPYMKIGLERGAGKMPNFINGNEKLQPLCSTAKNAECRWEQVVIPYQPPTLVTRLVESVPVDFTINHFFDIKVALSGLRTDLSSMGTSSAKLVLSQQEFNTQGLLGGVLGGEIAASYKQHGNLKVFWLVDDANNPVTVLDSTHPLSAKDSNGSDLEWYKVNPLTADGYLKPNQILITSILADAHEVAPITGHLSREANLLTDITPVIQATNRPDKFDILSATDFQSYYLDELTLTGDVAAFHKALKVKFKGVGYALSPTVAAGVRDADENYVHDFAVYNIDRASTFANTGSQKMSCRSFVKQAKLDIAGTALASLPTPFIDLSTGTKVFDAINTNTKVVLKIFCYLGGDNWVDPVGNTIDVETIVSSDPAKTTLNASQYLAFELRATPPAYAPTDTTFVFAGIGGSQSERLLGGAKLAAEQTKIDSQWSLDRVASFKWGTTASGAKHGFLLPTESTGVIRGVLGITDESTVVKLVPIEIKAINNDDKPTAAASVATTAIPDCAEDRATKQRIVIKPWDGLGGALARPSSQMQCWLKDMRYAASSTEPARGLTVHAIAGFEEDRLVATALALGDLTSAQSASFLATSAYFEKECMSPGTPTAACIAANSDGKRFLVRDQDIPPDASLVDDSYVDYAQADDVTVLAPGSYQVHALLQQGCAAPSCLVFKVQSALWPNYPTDYKYKPTLRRVLVAGTTNNYRWKFRWNVPGLLQADVKSRYARVEFNSGMDFPRKLFSAGAYYDHFAWWTTLRNGDAAYAQIADGSRDAPFKAGGVDLATMGLGGGDDRSLTQSELKYYKANWQKLPITVLEPNLGPCLIAKDTFTTRKNAAKDTTVGLSCDASKDGVSVLQSYFENLVPNTIDKPWPKTLFSDLMTISLIDVTVNGVAGKQVQLDFKYFPVLANGEWSWTPVYKNKSYSLDLYAYDPSKTVGKYQTLLLSNFIVPDSQFYTKPTLTKSFDASDPDGDTKLAKFTLSFTPEDRDLVKLGKSTAETFTTHVQMGDSTYATPADLKDGLTTIAIKVAVWDQNQVPALWTLNDPLKASSTYSGAGGSTTIPFLVKFREKDRYDGLAVRVLKDQLPVPLDVKIYQAANGTTRPSAGYYTCNDGCEVPCVTPTTGGDSSCTVQGQFPDSVALAGLPDFQIPIAFLDRPWHKIVNDQAAQDYVVAHPKKALLAEASTSVLAVSATKTASSTILNPDSVITFNVFKNQPLIIPILVAPYVSTLTCDISKNLTVPAGETQETIKVLTPTQAALYNIPGNVACVLYWMPQAGYSTVKYSSAARQFTVKIYKDTAKTQLLGTRAKYILGSMDNSIGTPGATGFRPKFSTFGFTVKKAGVALPSNPIGGSNDPDKGKVYYNMRDDDNYTVSLSGTTNLDVQMAWFLDGEPVAFGMYAPSTVAYNYNLSTYVALSKMRNLRVWMSDNGVNAGQALGTGEQALANEAGYQVLRTKLNVLNSVLIPTTTGAVSLVEPSGYTAKVLNLNTTDDKKVIYGVVQWTPAAASSPALFAGFSYKAGAAKPLFSKSRAGVADVVVVRENPYEQNVLVSKVTQFARVLATNGTSKWYPIEMENNRCAVGSTTCVEGKFRSLPIPDLGYDDIEILKRAADYSTHKDLTTLRIVQNTTQFALSIQHSASGLFTIYNETSPTVATSVTLPAWGSYACQHATAMALRSATEVLVRYTDCDASTAWKLITVDGAGDWSVSSLGTELGANDPKWVWSRLGDESYVRGEGSVLGTNPMIGINDEVAESSSSTTANLFFSYFNPIVGYSATNVLMKTEGNLLPVAVNQNFGVGSYIDTVANMFNVGRIGSGVFKSVDRNTGAVRTKGVPGGSYGGVACAVSLADSRSYSCYVADTLNGKLVPAN